MRQRDERQLEGPELQEHTRLDSLVPCMMLREFAFRGAIGLCCRYWDAGRVQYLDRWISQIIYGLVW